MPYSKKEKVKTNKLLDKLAKEVKLKVGKVELEDQEFALRTEEALEKYEKGEFKRKSVKEFLKDLKKW